jgi:hypothetical protein
VSERFYSQGGASGQGLFFYEHPANVPVLDAYNEYPENKEDMVQDISYKHTVNLEEAGYRFTIIGHNSISY